MSNDKAAFIIEARFTEARFYFAWRDAAKNGDTAITWSLGWRKTHMPVFGRRNLWWELFRESTHFLQRDDICFASLQVPVLSGF